VRLESEEFLRSVRGASERCASGAWSTVGRLWRRKRTPQCCMGPTGGATPLSDTPSQRYARGRTPETKAKCCEGHGMTSITAGAWCGGGRGRALSAPCKKSRRPGPGALCLPPGPASGRPRRPQGQPTRRGRPGATGSTHRTSLRRTTRPSLRNPPASPLQALPAVCACRDPGGAAWAAL
jgi:hypothetical protein